MIGRHGDWAIIVGRIAGSHVDRVEGRATGQRFADDRQLEHFLSIGTAVHEAEQAAVGAGQIGVGRDRQHRLDLALHRFAVDAEFAVTQCDRVAGQPDHAFDIVDACHRMFEHDDVAAFGQLAEQPARDLGRQVKADRRIGPAIGIFADDQPVAVAQHRHHRIGRNIKGLGDAAVDAEHEQQDHHDVADQLAPAPVILRLVLRHIDVSP